MLASWLDESRVIIEFTLPILLSNSAIIARTGKQIFLLKNVMSMTLNARCNLSQSISREHAITLHSNMPTTLTSAKSMV